ncbi:hypothetical protein P7K49_026202 [Saguinus oedipus]|uniref:Uncharacterized protein n=1 Tax=Saguinus oedipus TaxID=9490 RepID=A0ABQ9UCS9_SAGOE|nr:hypothetical protein P7K49_026202 [Saguinus oedipus]
MTIDALRYGQEGSRKAARLESAEKLSQHQSEKSGPHTVIHKVGDEWVVKWKSCQALEEESLFDIHALCYGGKMP